MAARQPVKGEAKLYMTVTVENAKGELVQRLYHLRFLQPHPEVANPAWRLTKTDGEFYDVAMTETGPTCTCPDWNFCRQNTPKACKHCEALRAVALLIPRRDEC